MLPIDLGQNEIEKKEKKENSHKWNCPAFFMDGELAVTVVVEKRICFAHRK